MPESISPNKSPNKSKSNSKSKRKHKNKSPNQNNRLTLSKSPIKSESQSHTPIMNIKIMDLIKTHKTQEDLKYIIDIIDNNKFDATELDANKNTLLMVAIRMNLKDIALQIIKTGKSNPGEANDQGFTALMFACSNRLSDVALELIKTGKSSPETVEPIGKVTALLIACMNRLSEVALELIKTGKSIPEAVDPRNGNTALIIACYNSDSKVALELIRTGKSCPEVVESTNGFTALLIACNLNLDEVALELIETGKSNPGVVANTGDTALLYACGNKMPEVALKLLETGISKPSAINDDGFTSLIYACMNKMDNVALELIKTGDSNPGAIAMKQYNALLCACKNGMKTVAKKIIETGKSIISSSRGRSINRLILPIAEAKDEDIFTMIKDEIKRVEKGYTVNLNATGHNFITMDTVKIKDWLSEDKDNICLVVDDKYYLTEKATIYNQLNDMVQIKYGCVKAINQLEYVTDKNIIYTYPYFALSSIIGVQVVVLLSEMEKALRNEHQNYSFSWDGTILNSIISHSFIKGSAGESSDHCQSGKRTYIYGIRQVKYTVEDEVQPSKSEHTPLPQSETINVQHSSGKTFTLDVKLDMTLEDIKPIFLAKLVLDGILKSDENVAVSFIFKGKVKLAKTKLTDLDPNPFGITLQSVIRKLASYGGTKRKKKTLRKYTKRV